MRTGFHHHPASRDQLFTPYRDAAMNMLHFQQQLHQHALNSSFLQRQMALHHSNGFSQTSPSSSVIPSVNQHPGWPPMYIPHQIPQHTFPELPTNLQVHGRGGPPAPPVGKDLVLNSSIESLRMRARQHSASMGIYE